MSVIVSVSTLSHMEYMEVATIMFLSMKQSSYSGLTYFSWLHFHVCCFIFKVVATSHIFFNVECFYFTIACTDQIRDCFLGIPQSSSIFLRSLVIYWFDGIFAHFVAKFSGNVKRFIYWTLNNSWHVMVIISVFGSFGVSNRGLKYGVNLVKWWIFSHFVDQILLYLFGTSWAQLPVYKITNSW